MAKPKAPNETEQLNVRIPTVIMTKVRILLTNPITGKIAYSRLSQLVTRFLKEWLEEQEKTLRQER